MVDIAITSTKNGGFQMQLPGALFKDMNQVACPDNSRDDSKLNERFKLYHEQK
jgi:hypothetical protein